MVVTDRYVDSTLAYQGAGRDLVDREVERIARWATADLRPNLTVVLDLPADRADPVRGAGPHRGREVEFHERVRDMFLRLASGPPEHYLVVDARKPVDEIAAEIRARVEPLLEPAVRSGRAAEGSGTRRAVQAAPGVWSTLVGQPHVVESLSRAVAGQGMTHAWLFTGPPGSGRSNAALAFAAALQCERAAAAPRLRDRARRESPRRQRDPPQRAQIAIEDMRDLVHRSALAPRAGVPGDGHRGRRPAPRARRQRAAQGDRGADPQDRVAAVRADPRGRAPDHPVPLPQRRATTPTAEEVARFLVDKDGVPDAVAAFAARASQGHIGRARALARDEGPATGAARWSPCRPA